MTVFVYFSSFGIIHFTVMLLYALCPRCDHHFVSRYRRLQDKNFATERGSRFPSAPRHGRHRAGGEGVAREGGDKGAADGSRALAQRRKKLVVVAAASRA